MIQTEHRDDTLCLTLEGPRIDAAGSVAFKEAARQSIDGWDGRVVMDMAAVDFVDSSGLGALVSVAKLLGKRRLELATCQPMVVKVFALTKMDRVFTLHSDMDAAIAHRSAA